MHFFFLYHETISSKTELLELLKINFTDVIISDIRYQSGKTNDFPYTKVAVFFNESDIALQSRDFYHMEEKDRIAEPDFSLSYVPPGHMKDMEKMGISPDSIREYGWDYKDFDGGWQKIPYEIYWYILDESYGYKGNVLIYASIPATLKFNIEKIMQN